MGGRVPLPSYWFLGLRACGRAEVDLLYWRDRWGFVESHSPDILPQEPDFATGIIRVV